MRFFVMLTVIVFSFKTMAGQPPNPPAEKQLTTEERPDEWLRATERLRQLPRPGEIRSAGVLVNIGDLIETTPVEKAAIVEATKAYDTALAKKAEQWENEMKTLRAEHQAKVIAAIPEARRDAAKKLLEYSQAQWTLPFEFEARMRTRIAEKFDQANAPSVAAEEANKIRREVRDWIKDQRQKEVTRNAEVMKTMKSMLEPTEAERLDKFDKNRVVPQPPKPPK